MAYNKANEAYGILRPAKIILPVQDNGGYFLDFAHFKLRSDLAKIWGGCTVTIGQGCWVNEHGKVFDEPVKIYTVAMPVSQSARTTLRNIAIELAAKCGQEAIYVEHADGTVEFVTAAEHNQTEKAA